MLGEKQLDRLDCVKNWFHAQRFPNKTSTLLSLPIPAAFAWQGSKVLLSHGISRQGPARIGARLGPTTTRRRGARAPPGPGTVRTDR